MATENLDQTIAAFNKDIANFMNKLLPEQVAKAQKKLVLELLRRIVLRTPVDTGRARANWQLTISEPATGEVPIGNQPLSQAAGLLAVIPPYSEVWITNNVPYILVLEDGSSKEAPNGMVEISLNEVRMMVL